MLFWKRAFWPTVLDAISSSREQGVEKERLFSPHKAECRNECTVSSDMEMDSGKMETE